MPAEGSKGISTGDFAEALAALLGPDAGGLSASTVARLTEVWAEEHAHWLKRDLSARHYVYFWADGIHVQARLEDDAQCLLVIIGATPEGKKELAGLIDGVRESAQSWRELLLDLKRRGLAVAPELAIADGALGFWKAIEQVWPRTRSQRCWVHKTANVLNKLPEGPCPGTPWRRPRQNRPRPRAGQRVMRHFLSAGPVLRRPAPATFAIAPLALRMLVTAPVAVLVTLPGKALRVPARSAAAAPGAIDVAVIAAGAENHLAKAAAYVARRTLEGLSKREIMRCLKRYVAREIYRVLTAPSSA